MRIRTFKNLGCALLILGLARLSVADYVNVYTASTEPILGGSIFESQVAYGAPTLAWNFTTISNGLDLAAGQFVMKRGIDTTNSITMQVLYDQNGSGDILATATLNANSFGTNYASYTFLLSSIISLEANHVYSFKLVTDSRLNNFGNGWEPTPTVGYYLKEDNFAYLSNYSGPLAVPEPSFLSLLLMGAAFILPFSYRKLRR